MDNRRRRSDWVCQRLNGLVFIMRGVLWSKGSGYVHLKSSTFPVAQCPVLDFFDSFFSALFPFPFFFLCALGFCGKIWTFQVIVCTVFEVGGVTILCRYHYNVADNRLSQHIDKGNEDGLLISSVASCQNLWALIMDAGTGFTSQVYEFSSSFLHKV